VREQVIGCVQSDLPRGRAPASARGLEAPRRIDAGERTALLHWLDDALRGGERGRLEAEYPLSLDRAARADASGHRVVFEAGRPVAHAMSYRVAVQAGRHRLAVGLIGLVHTAPHRRRRGLAAACVAACLDDLREAGVPLAALWTDRPAIYAGLGFAPAGVEHEAAIDAGLCGRARAARAGGDGLTIDVPRHRDWPVLEALYARRTCRAVRPRGALRRLAAAPHTHVVVARRAGRPLAYAAVGRGLDFQGVVHEWAGGEAGVLACLEALCDRFGPLALRWGPVDEAPVARLRAAGARERVGHAACVALLDAAGLATRLAGPALARAGAAIEPGPDAGSTLVAPAGRIALRPREVASLLFDAAPPSRVRVFLGAAVARALDTALPAPFYLWGFDSI